MQNQVFLMIQFLKKLLSPAQARLLWEHVRALSTNGISIRRPAIARCLFGVDVGVTSQTSLTQRPSAFSRVLEHLTPFHHI
uniref:Putative secreted protein n=1 Tax=Xenopsylla cheopis TaxID=163159 RepID=A0A6M2DZW9_XENCH